MPERTLTAVAPTPHEVAYLEDRIYEFNATATGINDGELLAFFVREGRPHRRRDLRQYVGRYLRVAPVLGGRAATSSRARDETLQCCGGGGAAARLPAFYTKHGFEIVATIDSHPSGHQNLLMRKSLEPS